MTNGFEIVQRVLDQSEATNVATELRHSTLVRSRAGARHLMRVPLVKQLARDSRLVTIAARFVGPEAVPFRATLFDKSPANNWLVVWHQDTALPLRERRDIPGSGPWSIKAGITYAHAPATALSRVVALRLHIDDSDSDNGPLRVLPGTHTMGVLSDTEIGQLAREIPPVDCVVPAGESLLCARSWFTLRRKPSPAVSAAYSTLNTPILSGYRMTWSWPSRDHDEGHRSPKHCVDDHRGDNTRQSTELAFCAAIT
jgi:hypothetical protein